MVKNERIYSPRADRLAGCIANGALALSALSLIWGPASSIALGLTHHALGLTVSLGIPFTNANISIGSSYGDPASLTNALPHYLTANANNLHMGAHSTENAGFSIFGQQGIALIGHQNGAPTAVDFNLSLSSPTASFEINPQV